MSCRETVRSQIVARLAKARFPIRNTAELAAALQGPDGESGGGPAGPIDAGEFLGLFSPRDFLFTNPWQIADLVAHRASFRSHGNPVH